MFILKKKRKIEYREKQYNMDTIIAGMRNQDNLGVHPPKEIDITKLKRKKSVFISK